MIRLQRVGRKHEPTFRVVLTDSRNSTKSGRFLEVLGSYDPRKTNESFNGERIKEWIGKGAKLSDTMHNLLVKNKIIDGKKINVLPKKIPPQKEEPVVAETTSTAEPINVEPTTEQSEAVIEPPREASVVEGAPVEGASVQENTQVEEGTSTQSEPAQA